MLKRIVTLSTVALMATLSTTAYAQPGGSDESALVGKGEGGTTVYDFEDDDVDGEVGTEEVGRHGAPTLPSDR